MGNFAEAKPWLRRSVEVRPNLWYNRAYLIAAYALSGDKTVAEVELQSFEERFPGHTLRRISAQEQSNPNQNPVIVKGRAKMHDGLLQAGMPP